jgi:predicted ATPase
MIKAILIQNFKIFESFKLILNDDLNIIVGDNEAGKSTILEAISLALTRKIGGKPIEYELGPYLFNATCSHSYLQALKENKNPELPKILIELYLADLQELQPLRGSNNVGKLDTVGIRLEIAFDDDYKEEYAKLLEDKTEKKVIPAEYFRVNWCSFAGNAITSRSLPISLSHIDATTIRLQSGTDYYIQNIISEGLAPKEKVALAVAYRKLKEQFSAEASIQGINKNLTKGALTEKELTIGIDISQKTNWETNLIPHLDELPFQLVGKGEQTALKILLALDRKAKDSNIILIEEPENHLSFSSMNKLISKIAEKCAGKQIIIATHSAYVLNKLGIEKVFLLNEQQTMTLKNLPPDTQKYFKKLSGYDTLRLILAKKAILVEGPSDELVVQKAYKAKHGKLPIEDGVDVINVRGLSFTRFLDIAKELKKEVVVVTDNDGDYQKKVVDKYAPYKGIAAIKICADSDKAAKTLEPQMAKTNTLALLNKIFGTAYADVPLLVAYMENNKTEWALKLFESDEAVTYPKYIADAVQ